MATTEVKTLTDAELRLCRRELLYRQADSVLVFDCLRRETSEAVADCLANVNSEIQRRGI
jgi:hypothetical protein